MKWLCIGLLLLTFVSDLHAHELDPARTEYSTVPAFTYTRDDGLGVGLLGVVAKFKEGFRPYQWRLEVLTYLNLRKNADGRIESPTQAHWILIDMPGLLGSGNRVQLQVGYANLNLFYYGLGNATSSISTSRHRQFQRTGIPVELTVRFEISKALFISWITQFVPTRILVFGGSKLRSDLAGEGGKYVRNTLHGAADHKLVQMKIGLEWDTRDHETVPQHGMRHELQVLGGYGVPEAFLFCAANATARFFHAIWPKVLVLAARVSAHVFMGQAPFYLLPQIGSPWSVRGVPIGKYRGKARVLGNVELRSRFIEWGGGAHRFHLGVVGFVDTGRVWADLESRPELDGTGHGLKIGTGGGLRFQWGETVILRFESAWSPDGVGHYININHTF